MDGYSTRSKKRKLVDSQKTSIIDESDESDSDETSEL